MSPALASHTAHRRNLFDLVRLVAASVVLIYHSFPLSGAREPFHSVLGLTLGTTALMAFFGISGYLVTASWTRDPRVVPYAAKRALRVLPGLVLCSLLTALVLGPLVTSLDVGQYLSRSGPYAYFAKQSLLETFNPTLPGVFLHNPLPGVVNGSTWTLPIEVCCYASVAVAGLVGALQRPRLLLAGLGLVVLAMVLGAPADSATGHGPTGAATLVNALRPCGGFLTGACLWLARDRLPRGRALMALAIAVIFLPAGVGVRSAIDMLAIPYLAVRVGSLPAGRLAVLTGLGDVSYGIYIYAYPVQQTLAQAAPGISPLVLTCIALPIAWLLGLASWHAVERRAIAFKARLPQPRSRTAAVGDTAPAGSG